MFSPPEKAGPAQAEFEWEINGKMEFGDWVDDGRPAPAALSRIAVFDSHCARVFVDDQAAVSFIPYGLDVLRDLALGLQRVQRLLEDEAQREKFDMRRLATLQGDTVVGKLIASLKHSTAVKTVEDQAGINAEEELERQLLVKLLLDEDPAKQAVALRRFAVRLQTLENEVAALQGTLSDGHLAKLGLAFEQLIAAETASKLASASLAEEVPHSLGRAPIRGKSWSGAQSNSQPIPRIRDMNFQAPTTMRSVCYVSSRFLQKQVSV